MERKTLLCVVIACLAMASCATQRIGGESTTSQGCNGTTCQIAVSVSGSDIVVDPEFLIVNGPRNQLVNIIWRLPQDSPYTLKIEIIGGSGEFDCSADGPRQYKCNNKHSGAK